MDARSAVETEISKLTDEVARLRLMVERINESGRSTSEASSQQQQPHPAYRDPFTVPVPLPSNPVAVLPTIFAGPEGTARLFRLLMDAYPWLVPPEVEEAREVLAKEKEKQMKRLQDAELAEVELRKTQMRAAVVAGATVQQQQQPASQQLQPQQQGAGSSSLVLDDVPRVISAHPHRRELQQVAARSAPLMAAGSRQSRR